MRLRFAVVALALLSDPVGARQAAPNPPPRSPQNASYKLVAKLDPRDHSLEGYGRLVWRNISKAPATELRFHLYWNAWRNSASSWMREDSGNRRSALARRPAEDWARIDLSTLTVRSEPEHANQNLLARARFIAPDDGNPDDRTVLSAPLDRPVAPGETIEIDLAWTSHVPRTFSRTGVIGEYYFIAQWFPKIGVLQDDGTWNCHQFHVATEFFSDFGNYDVTIIAPPAYRVGATGRPVVLDEAGPVAVRAPLPRVPFDHPANFGKTRFIQTDVHDFAWVASPDFIEWREDFNEPGLPKVDMRLLLLPEHAQQKDRHFAATRAALKYYGTWFGPYPYDHITVVDPVTIFNADAQGGSSGGMEYPTLFTAGTRYFAPWTGLSPESVTVHEAGHQFWYGLVATNEFEHAWMDEGFNSFSQARVVDEAYRGRVRVGRYFGGLAAWAFPDVPWTRDVDGGRIDGYRLVASYDIQSSPTWRYWPASASQITYSKTALWLATLERVIGWDTLQKIMTTYFSRGAFRHPAPDEFFAIANEVSGRDLTWFFDAVYRSSAVFDYGVAQVTGVPADARGFADGARGGFAAGGGGRIDSTVVVRRYGDGVFPVDVHVTFEDGHSAVEQWDGRDRWRSFRYRRAAPVATVEIDPKRVLLLDVNYTNNSWTSQPKAREASRKWLLRWLTWLEEKLLTYAFFS